ncbi:MAG: hypothetical protein J7639_20625 [Paenibacillaceae bacterium]|nr:hypothetical protein [Paenibacillaceae bacterium]
MIETVYRLVIEVGGVPREKIAAQEQRLGYFVLATKVMDATLLSTRDVLKECKEQSKRGVALQFLKDPAFVDALFLKTPERIEALSYLLLIALFVCMIMENRLRLALKQTKTRLQPERGHYTDKPTAKPRSSVCLRWSRPSCSLTQLSKSGAAT